MGLFDFIQMAKAAKQEIAVDAILKRHFGLTLSDESIRQKLSSFRPGVSSPFTIAFYCAGGIELLEFASSLSEKRRLEYGRNVWLVTVRHARMNNLATPESIDYFLETIKHIFSLKSNELEGMEAELAARWELQWKNDYEQ